MIETHPGGGQYDCLDVLLPGGSSPHGLSASFNRLGGAHFWLGPDEAHQWPGIWEEYLGTADPRHIVQEVCARAGLPVVRRSAAGTPAVLVYRFVAAFMTQSILGGENWECRNGYRDSSGMEDSGVRSEWFASFPAARARLLVRLSDDPLGEPARRFWFICESRRPRLCLETSGRAWDLEGAEFDLMKLYRVRHRIWPVVSFVARDLLR